MCALVGRVMVMLDVLGDLARWISLDINARLLLNVSSVKSGRVRFTLLSSALKTSKLIFLTFMCVLMDHKIRLSVRIRQIRQSHIVFDVHCGNWCEKLAVKCHHWKWRFETRQTDRGKLYKLACIAWPFVNTNRRYIQAVSFKIAKLTSWAW